MRQKSRVLRAASILALLVACSFPVYAQIQSSLRGTITDPSGAPIPNVTVHLTDITNNSDRTTVTDQRGLYAFPEVPAGTYRLTAVAPGFDTLQQDGVRLQTGLTSTIDLNMKIGQVQQNVTVTGQGTDLCLVAQARILPDVGPGLRTIRRGPSGSLYVLTAPGTAAGIFSPNGKKIGQIPAAPSGTSSIKYGSDLQFDAAGRVYIADRGDNAIKIYDANGALTKSVRVPAPISIEPLSPQEIAVSSLFSAHMVDVYDIARGEVFRSFGDVPGPPAPECDPVTLRCTIHEVSGYVSDAAHLKDAQPPRNRTWFYGDSTGNVYIDLVDQSDPTIRKYDSYGYLAFESPLAVSQAGADLGWNVGTATHPGTFGNLGALDPKPQNGGATLSSPSQSREKTNRTQTQMGGGRPMVIDSGTFTEGPSGVSRTAAGDAARTSGAGSGTTGGTEINRMTFAVRSTARATSSSTAPNIQIDAIGVELATQDVWEAIAGNLVHLDKDGRLAGYYCLSTTDNAPIKPTTLLVESDRILVGTDPFGIFQYARPDKPQPEPTPPPK